MFRRLFRIAPRSAQQVAAETRDEIESNIALRIEHLIARGVDPAEAGRQARAR